MGVAAAVERDLAALALRDSALAESSLALSALCLAQEMDSDNSATSKSMCGRELRDTLDRLRELAPEVKQKDRVDDLAKRREDRRSTAASY